MKQSTYIKAIQALPYYFIEDNTRFCTIDDNRMIVANPKLIPMWYDAAKKKPKWVLMSDPGCPFKFDGKNVTMRDINGK
jgi:hypothetical protein